MPLYGLVYSVGVYQFAPDVAPKFLPNVCGGRNGGGVRGVRGVRGEGVLQLFLLLFFRSHTRVLTCQKKVTLRWTPGMIHG